MSYDDWKLAHPPEYDEPAGDDCLNCQQCDGEGMRDVVVGHHDDGEPVWDAKMCDGCNGNGVVPR